MSYSEFLNRKKINSPKVIAQTMTFGDASSFTWRRKMASATVYRPTDHVITNVSDPSVVPNFNSKKPTVYAGTGYGGKVMAASDYTLSRSAAAIGADVFSPTKLISVTSTRRGSGDETVCIAPPPASQVVNQNGNYDAISSGLNLGYVASCPSGYFTPGVEIAVPAFRPLTKTHFVDTIPDLKTRKVGVQGQEVFAGLPNTQSGSQNPIVCSSTNTSGNWEAKSATRPNLHPVGPIKTDFLTGVLGPQVSADGAGVRAPKVGAALDRNKYVEGHHGSARPRAWGPRASALPRGDQPAAPAQLKINGPQHYPVA
jgi:hypothetical protein